MMEELHKGHNKTLYKSDKENTIILSFTDQVKLNNTRTIEVYGKGVINNCLSAYIMQKLDMVGIDNHFISKLNMREQEVQFVDMFPIQLSMSTIASDRYVKDFKMEEGYVFDAPIIDFRVKNNDLNYPPINEHQIINFGWINEKEIDQLKKIALRIYDFLSGLFVGVGIRLIQCNLEFGRVFNGEDFTVLLADEITPDNCKLWDLSNNEKLGLEALLQKPETGIETYKKIISKFNISSSEF